MRLARYKGRYWWLEGLKDYRGFVSLISLNDSSAGVSADPRKVKEITGKEYERQVKTIQYFNTLKRR